MKRDEVKKLLTEAKARKLLVTIVFTDNRREWMKAAGILVDESVNGKIELDPPNIEAELCIAALGDGWQHEMHEVSFYPTEHMDTDQLLDRILPGIALLQVQESGIIFRAPFGGAITFIRSC